MTKETITVTLPLYQWLDIISTLDWADRDRRDDYWDDLIKQVNTALEVYYPEQTQ